MRNAFLMLVVKSEILWNTIEEERGQDLVEYAAVIALVVLALAGGMSTLASGINSAMGGLGTKISNMLS